MIAALGETLRAIIWSSIVVAVVYAAVMMGAGGPAQIVKAEVLIRIPFFFVVALFYGYFAQLVRSERSKRVEYQKQLSAAKRVREISGQLTRTLDRSRIMETLVQTARPFCQAEYAAVISRGTESILAESGDFGVSSGTKRCAVLLTDLNRRIETEESHFPSLCPSGLPAVEGDQRPNPGDHSRVCFSNGLFTFLPVSGQKDSDLYLCLIGRSDHETIEYVRLLLLNASMALNNAGQYQELVHEVEKRKDVVERLSRVLKFKSEFVANISHEIRTPIYSFIGFAELLLGGGYGELPSDQQKVVNRMLDNARSLLQLINNILDNARLDSGEYRIRSTSGKMTAFVQEIAETCAPLLKDKPVSMHVACEEEIPTVVTDWGILRQIAMNLVSNAVKFTPKGRVDILSGYDAEQGRLYFTVRDTGVGVSPEQVSQIFEPFRQLDNSYTRKYAGTGLGLALTKKQIEILGGEIKVESKPNYGSEFAVILPVKYREEEHGQVEAIETVSNQDIS